MSRHERKFQSIKCHLESAGRVHMTPDDIDYMSDIKQIDNLVYTASTLVTHTDKVYKLKAPGFFADTLDQLIAKVKAGEEESLYDILDTSEAYRYVTCHSHKCYALYLPSAFLDIFLKKIRS